MTDGIREHLFRQSALDRLASPDDRLDELLIVSPSRSWLALAGLWAVLLVLAAWGLWGTIPTLIRGEGILIRAGSVHTVDAPADGQLREVLVDAGDEIRSGQIIAWFSAAADGHAVPVSSPVTGRVLELRAGTGDRVEAGDSLLSLEESGGSLDAILYLPPTDAVLVQPGMEVQLAPASVKKDEHGLLLGHVATVGSLPASQAGMRQALGSDELAAAFSAAGPRVEVRVELERDGATASGYQWTSTRRPTGSLLADLPSAALKPIIPGQPRATGPSIALASGTPCTVDIVVGQEAPMRLVLAGLSW